MSWTTTKLAKLKGKEKIVCLTAYDSTTAKIVDACDIHLIMIGDSLGMTRLGYDTTLPVTMEDMISHTAAVARTTKNALVVADMPFLSYQVSIEQAVENAGRLFKEGQADAVKIEGGTLRSEVIKTLVANGMPVMGHVGLTPQSVKAFGGFKVQGKDDEQAQRIVDDALAVADAGAFSVVLEGVPADLAERITNEIAIPTIGIGAGPACDGQVLVINDMLGLSGDFSPKFVKQYADIGHAISEAVTAYKRDVTNGSFPGPEHCY